MMRILMPAAAAAAGALLLAGCQSADARTHRSAVAQRAPSGLMLTTLRIRSGSRVHAFRVEVARTAAEQEKGLMFRRSLAPNSGMIFPFNPPQPVSFWMKNTWIPLDLIFIRQDGTIARIAANAKPESLDLIQAGEPVATVLEIAGGRAAQLGITERDRVSWPGGPSF
jgi:uncharacterized membrane protein (UPF0127 family)